MCRRRYSYWNVCFALKFISKVLSETNLKIAVSPPTHFISATVKYIFSRTRKIIVRRRRYGHFKFWLEFNLAVKNLVNFKHFYFRSGDGRGKAVVLTWARIVSELKLGGRGFLGLGPSQSSNKLYFFKVIFEKILIFF